MSRQKRERDGPESRTYQKLKGQMVRVWPIQTLTNDPWIGKLVWVDTYTIGVAFNPKRPDDLSIVYKNAIRIDPFHDVD